jgi:tetratricopeptide (TPR) repeat protein
MIAIAVFALIFAVWAWYRAWIADLHRPLNVFSGPGGPIDLRDQFFQELGRGYSALEKGDFDEAEARYTAAVRLVERSSSRDDQTGWYNLPAALIGLADSFAWRRRFDEAEPLYTRALAISEDGYGRDYPMVAEVLEHYAAALDRAGRASDRDRIASRAEAIRTEVRRKRTEEDSLSTP